MAIHRDTNHVHAHLVINRVNPTSYKAVYPDRDFFKLDRAMRELELRFGWRHDCGPYAVFERNGMMVIDWASREPQTKGRMPSAAPDMERHPSLQHVKVIAHQARPQFGDRAMNVGTIPFQYWASFKEATCRLNPTMRVTLDAPEDTLRAVYPPAPAPAAVPAKAPRAKVRTRSHRDT